MTAASDRPIHQTSQTGVRGMSDTYTTYTTSGSVRGCCGHRHRTIEAAKRCIDKDHAGCARQGGYSDRTVVYYDGSELNSDDRDYVNNLD